MHVVFLHKIGNLTTLNQCWNEKQLQHFMFFYDINCKKVSLSALIII